MKKYRLFGVINPIDVLLVGLVLVVIWGAMQLAQPQVVEAEGGQRIRYTFELAGRPAGFHEEIEIGLNVFCGVQNWHIGTIVDVLYAPMTADASDESAGIVRHVQVPELEFTIIIIEAWAEITDYATNVGNFWVAANRQVGIRSRDFGGIGFITNIEWVEG